MTAAKTPQSRRKIRESLPVAGVMVNHDEFSSYEASSSSFERHLIHGVNVIFACEAYRL